MSTECVVLEHKTTTQDIGPGSPYWRRLALDGQLSKYLVGARALGFEPTKILYDVAKRPQQRPMKATPIEDRKYTKPTKAEPTPRLYSSQRETDETVEEFALRIREDIAANPEKYFQRGTVVRLEEEERDAAYDTWVNARQIREAQIAKRWPRNVDACETYGSMCDFWPVCSGESSIDDPTRYTRVEHQHTELSAPEDGKVRLPLVTSSSLKCFRACPRRYYLRYELGYRTRAVSEAIRFGTLFHKGLEAWWKTASLDEALAAMAGEADPFERAKAEELMRGYHARWIGESLEVLAVEAEFEAPLVNPETGAESRTFRRGGKIDAIARVYVAAGQAA